MFEKLKRKLTKIDLISYYKKDEKYFVLKNRLNNNELINKEINEFSKSEFKEYINLSFLDNSFTYVSTFIDSANQGIVDSCSHSHYKDLGIDIDSIKILCINNSFSIFIGLYDFNNLKKENEIFKYDYIYSPYAIISNNGIENNKAYILTFEEYIILMIVEEKPIYGNIYYFKENAEVVDSDSQIDLDSIDDIGILDDIEDLSDSLEDSIEDAADLIEEDNDDNLEESVDSLKNEVETVEFLKTSFKDYYDNYSDHFLEEVVILNNYKISDTLDSTIEKEFFLNVKTKEFDILNAMNLLAKEDINV
jgi:hypothetical protein